MILLQMSPFMMVRQIAASVKWTRKVECFVLQKSKASLSSNRREWMALAV